MEQLTDSQNLVVGCIAGCVEVMIDHPLITIKNMKQQSLPISLHPTILYRGLIADMAGVASLTALQFYATGYIKHLMLKYKHGTKLSDEFNFTSLTQNEIFISSFCGGAISGVVISPFELIMVQQQRYGYSIINTFNYITNKFGATIMTRGLMSGIFREGIFTFGYLGMTPILENHFDNNGYLYKFGCAMISGFIATGLSHPFDTIKTCMQGDVNRKQFDTFKQSFKFLYSTYGLQKIYSGFMFRFSANVLSFFVFNRVIEFVAPKLYPSQLILEIGSL
eukprot:465553_1